MLRFWIVVLGITGIAVALLILSSPLIQRWHRWIVILWVAAVVVTAMLVVVAAIYHW